MTVIFLDIDGVLQPTDAENRFNFNIHNLQNKLTRNWNYKYIQIDPYDLAATYYDWFAEAIEAIRKLIKNFSAKIVISSNWRRYNSLEHLKLLFHIYDLDSYVIDYIPDFLNNKFLEILFYLDQNPQIDNFVIIDDYEPINLDFFNDFMVKTEVYFEQYDLEKAEKILKEKKKFVITDKMKKLIPEIIWTSERKAPKITSFNGSEVFVCKIENSYRIFKFNHLGTNGYFTPYIKNFDTAEEAIQMAKNM